MAGVGAFIVLEGPDGAGKTTHARRLVQELERRGLKPVLAREPGGTSIGEKIREILLDPANDPMDVRTELFLYMASRAQLCRYVLQPAVRGGAIVIADRFLPSSAVYQGVAGGVGLERVLAMGEIATSGLAPDLTILLDLDAERSVERVARGRVRDRVERKDIEYHRRVCEGYRGYAKLAREPLKVIDATRSEEAVFADIMLAVTQTLPLGLLRPPADPASTPAPAGWSPT